MSSTAHALIALVYTVLAIAVALTLPYSAPSVEPVTALVIGGMVFLFGAILHEVAARQQRDKALARWLARLRSGDEELAAGLDQLSAELRGLHAAPRPPTGIPAGNPVRAERVEAVATPAQAPTPPPPVSAAELSLLARELRSLRSLVGGHTAAPPQEAPAEEGGREAPWDGDRLRPGDVAVIEAVRAALSGDRVEAYIQPIVTLPQRRHRFYEVSARLRLDDGELEPETYLPAARQEGLTAFIDNLLLFRTIQLLREADRRGQQVGFVCALTPDSLADGAFLHQFAQFMAQNTALAGRLMFELPQAELFDDAPAARAMLDELGRLGFRFVMSGLVHLDFDAADLSARHIRFVKLDAGMLLETPGPFGDLGSVVSLKHELERSAMDLIVTGIATEQQLVELLDFRFDFGQGSLFGEPKPARRPG
jgi:cyclic-di-GMP phosphodiesterase, flagellum assembly factor TipF